MEMEGGLVDDEIEIEIEIESESESERRRKSSAAGGNKRGRDDDREATGRGLEKRPSGVINVMEEYSYSYSYSGDEMINGVKYEEEKETPSPSPSAPAPAPTATPTPGLLNQLITSVVNNQQEPDSLIPTITGGGVPDDDKGDQVAEVNEKGQKNATEEDHDAGAANNNIIDNIVARLPRTLSEDTAPATDEASILIHSIIHD